MNIIYLTTAMDETDFRDYLSHWKKAPNPSNQNFHNKMIRSLSLDHKVTVISCRPFSKQLVDIKYLKAEEKNIDGIHWHYINATRSVFKKIIFGKKQVLGAIKKYKESDSVLFVDTINPLLIHYVKSIRKANPKIKIIGIVTDSPSNISDTKKSFTTYLLSAASDFDGYVALTPDLNELYNRNEKPYIIIHGVAENNGKSIEKPQKPYFFFGGCLMSKYGIYNLIDAFRKINDFNLELYIAGHRENRSRLIEAIGPDSRVKFLGALSLAKTLQYEMGAVANINPRPYTEDLDRYSIPSKTLEYLASGRPTISTRNNILQKVFPSEVVWAKTGSVEDLVEAMLKVLSFSEEEKKDLGQKAKQVLYENYSLRAVCNKLTEFLKTL